jgi:catechol 2,3-dioxygenase
MEIGARLHHVQLLSLHAEACAAFYGRIYGMRVRVKGSMQICTATDRSLIISPGQSNRLGFAAYSFSSREHMERYRPGVAARTAVEPATSPLFGPECFSVTDPDGNSIVFGIAPAGEQSPQEPLPARLQHLALRSREPSKLIAFYRDVLGFIVSDRVNDSAGQIRACFLRTDSEHHTLAIFHADEAVLDHLSFETNDWLRLRDWADRMCELNVQIVWGIGRHGPGNDAFFMVRDPDGNLAEISTELEVCEPLREAGIWPHNEQTLNLWGRAIMRS